MSKFTEVLQVLHGGKSPYEGYPVDSWKGTWYNDPGAAREIFTKAIEMAKPGVVIEVGSFVGESAIHMGRIIKSMSLDAVIICVDTWMAGIDHYKGAPEKIRHHFGRADLYYKFIANVIQHGMQDVILPLSIDSLNGSRVLKHFGIQADLIYVDGSHEKGDVFRDYEAYWDLVRPGKVLMVDDLTNHFPGVVHDFDKFLKKIKITPVLTEGEKAILIKP
jgi:predicted O-methyltransferase YrrM